VPKAPPLIPRGALQRWRHLRSVNAATLLHTDSGGHLLGTARTRWPPGAGSGIACSSTRTVADRRTNHRQRCGLRATRRATRPNNVDTRLVGQSHARGATRHVHGKFTGDPHSTIPARWWRRSDLTHIGKIPIVRASTLEFLQCRHLAIRECRHPPAPRRCHASCSLRPDDRGMRRCTTAPFVDR
jgi:hypothetical protein